jgi:hypothetical protein
MALVLADRVRETTTTTGVNDISLSGAVVGYQSFAVIGDTNTTYYCLAAQSNDQWEVGVGTYNSGTNTLARTTVLSNSEGTQPTKINFLGSTKDIFVTYPEDKAVYLDGSGNVIPLGTISSAVWNGSTIGVAYGGTGASNATDARTNLGLGTIATQNANSVAITGGSVDGTTVGATAASTGSFTNFVASGTATFTSNEAVKIPVGTTAQRPAIPAAGMMRQNSTTGLPEWYSATAGIWIAFNSTPSYSITYLAIAGGGGGSFGNGGGGGAGGILSATGVTVNAGTSLPVVVGAGGSAGVNGVNPTAGANSTFNSLTAIGGGQAGQGNGATGSGGCGGGANGQNSVFVAGGAGTGGQGFAGGGNATSAKFGGGGGGGTSAVGATGTTGASGAGGAGTSNSISGSAVTYGGGGGGGRTASAATAGAGGVGGGGAGGGSDVVGASGTANLGGGGGGGGYGASNQNGGAGGSGVVIISYSGSQRGTGGTVTSSGGNTIHTFTTSGTYTA